MKLVKVLVFLYIAEFHLSCSANLPCFSSRANLASTLDLKVMGNSKLLHSSCQYCHHNYRAFCYKRRDRDACCLRLDAMSLTLSTQMVEFVGSSLLAGSLFLIRG
jgi:hypothetical protein